MADGADDRVSVQVRVSEDARDGLHRFCFDHGITVTAMIEALGVQLAETGKCNVPEMVAAARRIDYERRNKRWSG